MEKAEFLSAFARDVATRPDSELSKIMKELAVVLDQNNRRFQILAGI